MAAIVEIDESNGATEVVSHDVASLAMGMTDATGMTPGAAGARQTPSSSSMAKMLRVHLTALGGGLGIAGLRVYCDPSVAGWSLYSNASAVAGTYAGSKLTTYLAPSVAAGPVPNALPVADPGSPNLGIAGSLTGQLTAPGWSDYLRLQLRAAADVVASFTSPCFFAYDDVG
jgi:hypothetical protein